MSVIRQVGITFIVIAGFIGGCSVAEVETADLVAVVERDAISFQMESIPDDVLDRLASNRVVVVGETHWIYEHRDLMAKLLGELHSKGFRQLILEFPQATEWLLDDYMSGGLLEPDWVPPIGLNGDLITAVREFNQTVPEDERVIVQGIDVMLDEYGGASVFLDVMQAISRHISDQGPLDQFTKRPYDTPERQADNLNRLKIDLETQRAELDDSWGEYWYNCVSEMVDVEATSVTIRDRRDDDYDYSAKMRENVMKELADARLKNYPHKTLINVGGNHAQKSRLKGTKQEWLGDYLVHKSSAIGGSITVVNVVPTRIVSEDGSQEVWNITGVSPPNELWRVMSEVRPDELIFLPLDDAIFSEDGVLMNYEDTIYHGAPKQYYDIFISLPIAHRIPNGATDSP